MPAILSQVDEVDKCKKFDTINGPN